MKTSHGTWNGQVEVPEFRVTADSKEEAGQLAREIIDPLELTGVNVTVTEEETGGPVALARLEADLGQLAGAVMTPYEHYVEAEQLLARAKMLVSPMREEALAKAQVHATLACAVIPHA